MALPPMIEMPVETQKPELVSASFKIEKNTKDRMSRVKTFAKNLGAKKVNLDEHVDKRLNDLLDSMEISLSDHGYPLDERVQRIKDKKEAASKKKKAGSPALIIDAQSDERSLFGPVVQFSVSDYSEATVDVANDISRNIAQKLKAENIECEARVIEHGLGDVVADWTDSDTLAIAKSLIDEHLLTPAS